MPLVDAKGDQVSPSSTRMAPSSVKPIFGQGGVIIGYEVTYSDDSFDVLSPKEYDNLVKYGTTEDPEEEKGGGGGSATPYGYSAPDPVGAGSLLLNQFDGQIAAGQLSFQQAKELFDEQWNLIVSNSNIESSNVTNTLTADTTNAGLTRDYAQMGQDRAANIATAQGNLNSQVTQRYDTTTRFLPNTLPVGTTVNLPGVGPVPMSTVNLNDLMNQGMPALSDQFSNVNSLFPDVGSAPVVTAGTINPIQAPPPPQFQMPPQMPDISAFVNAAMAGSGPMGFT